MRRGVVNTAEGERLLEQKSSGHLLKGYSEMAYCPHLNFPAGQRRYAWLLERTFDPLLARFYTLNSDKVFSLVIRLKSFYFL